jgi:hypothetical protein
VDATVNASFLQDDMESKFTPVLDANLPIESDYIWRKILCGPSETTYNFTVWFLHPNSVDTRQRHQPQQEKVLVADIKFVKSVDDAIVPVFVWQDAGKVLRKIGARKSSGRL